MVVSLTYCPTVCSKLWAAQTRCHWVELKLCGGHTPSHSQRHYLISVFTLNTESWDRKSSLSICLSVCSKHKHFLVHNSHYSDHFLLSMWAHCVCLFVYLHEVYSGSSCPLLHFISLTVGGGSGPINVLPLATLSGTPVKLNASQ